MGGFLSGFAGSILGGFVKGLEYAEGRIGTIIKVTMTAIAGGTASVLGGGKFANGAMSAAFIMMFNELQSVDGTPEEQAEQMRKRFGYNQDPNARALVKSLGTNAENWYNKDAPIAYAALKTFQTGVQVLAYGVLVGKGVQFLALKLYDTTAIATTSFIAGLTTGSGFGLISVGSGYDPLDYSPIEAGSGHKR